MDEKVEIEIEIDADLIEEVEKVAASMGVTTQQIFEAAIEYLGDPENEETAIKLLKQWKEADPEYSKSFLAAEEK